ncbi:TPA: hypothetical protein ACT5B2_000135 [Burkholderia cenocepacia]
MQLRHGPDFEHEFDGLYPRVEKILCGAVATNKASCEAGVLRAATRYLARTLAEYSLRKRNHIPDARSDPEDEVYWREELALKGDWATLTGFPDGSRQQEAIKKIIGEPSTESIQHARALRAEARKSLGLATRKEGGARYALANAIRHAWLICHDDHEAISYGRQKDKCGDPSGALHEFIKSIVGLIPVHVSADELHRNVQAIDRGMHRSDNSVP